jgi:Na+/H+ antiporter NhaA
MVRTVASAAIINLPKGRKTDDMANKGIYHAPWGKAFDSILTPLEEFIHRQTTSGILLMICAVAALVGLLLGKPVGIVGFTMSIFIADLGFVGMPEDLLMARTGILLASLIAGVGGFFWLKLHTHDRVAEQ